MRQLMILNLFMIGTIFSAFAQKTIATYDVNKDRQTTVVIKDSGKSDQDILKELDLDDYMVGEEVYITAEMWAKMQAEKQEKDEPKEEIIIQEKIIEKPVREAMPSVPTKAKKPSVSTKAKKKKKKSKRYKLKKSKRKKPTKRGRMACYSF